MREEFCTAVKILLQRMETHPEEFYKPLNPSTIPTDAKWTNLMAQVIATKNGEKVRGDVTFLTDVEIDALYEGYTKIRRKAFDDHVMNEILNPDEEAEKGVPLKMYGRYSPPPEGLLTHNNNAFVYGSVAEAQAARSTMLQQIQARQQGLLGGIK
jgi:hypothetical protein